LVTSATRSLAGWHFAFCLLVCGPASAQVVITPVLLELGARQRAVTVSVTLSEQAPAPMLLQSEVLRWSQQVDGDPMLEPTADLLVAPAIAELRPGQTQLFRVAMGRPRDGQDEVAYRLILEDSAEPTGTADPESGMTIKFRMRYDLPVFVAPPTPVHRALRWQSCEAAVGRACVSLANNGNRRVSLKHLVVEGAGWQKELPITSATVLAGASRQWVFDLPEGPAGPIKVKAETATGLVTAELSASVR
jgi:fimbrial chaperone protein